MLVILAVVVWLLVGILAGWMFCHMKLEMDEDLNVPSWWTLCIAGGPIMFATACIFLVEEVFDAWDARVLARREK